MKEILILLENGTVVRREVIFSPSDVHYIPTQDSVLYINKVRYRVSELSPIVFDYDNNCIKIYVVETKP